MQSSTYVGGSISTDRDRLREQGGQITRRRAGGVAGRGSLLEEVRGRLNQLYGYAALHGHMGMKIDPGADHVAIKPVSACLSGLSFRLEGLDADQTAATGPARIDGHPGDVRTPHVLESLHGVALI